MSEPCPRCGVRPDVACKHRPADPQWLKVSPPDEKGLGSRRGSTRGFIEKRSRS